MVNTKSARLQTFMRSTTCACCGLQGSFFAKEKHRFANQPGQQTSPHLNLYAVKDGNEVMMTSDHIIPKANGGALVSKRNRQTLCYTCNQLKADRNVSNEELREEIKHGS